MIFVHDSIFLQVIPPGMDFSNVEVQEEDADGELIALTSTDGSSPKAFPPIWSEVSILVAVRILFSLLT